MLSDGVDDLTALSFDSVVSSRLFSVYGYMHACVYIVMFVW